MSNFNLLQYVDSIINLSILILINKYQNNAKQGANFLQKMLKC